MTTGVVDCYIVIWLDIFQALCVLATLRDFFVVEETLANFIVFISLKQTMSARLFVAVAQFSLLHYQGPVEDSGRQGKQSR